VPDLLSRLAKIFSSSIDVGVARWTTVFGEAALARLIPNSHTHAGIENGDLGELLRELAAHADRVDPLTLSLAVDLITWLPDDLLVKVDRMSMAHGVEVRAPFLDHKVVELALAMGNVHKADTRNNKKILRRLLAKKLPAQLREKISARKKHGFEVPIIRWLRGELRELAEERLSERALNDLGFIDPAYVRALWEQFNAGDVTPSFARKIWLLLCFACWHSHHENKFGVAWPAVVF
jgi:asparagine synthase (glutamine-hydrolysing)